MTRPAGIALSATIGVLLALAIAALILGSQYPGTIELLLLVALMKAAWRFAHRPPPLTRGRCRM